MTLWHMVYCMAYYNIGLHNVKMLYLIYDPENKV